MAREQFEEMCWSKNYRTSGIDVVHREEAHDYQHAKIPRHPVGTGHWPVDAAHPESSALQFRLSRLHLLDMICLGIARLRMNLVGILFIGIIICRMISSGSVIGTGWAIFCFAVYPSFLSLSVAVAMCQSNIRM